MAEPLISLSYAGATLTTLARKLVNEGHIDKARAVELQKAAEKEGESFFRQVLKNGPIDRAVLYQCASEAFGIPYLDLAAMDAEHMPLGLIDQRVMEEHQVLPLVQRGSKLFVAVGEPDDYKAIEVARFHTGLGVEPVLVDLDRLRSEIESSSSADLGDLLQLGDERLEDIDISTEKEDESVLGEGDEEIEIDTPIVRFVNKVLLDAIRRNASDIHIEPYEKKLRVRFRIDGVLHEITSPPIALSARIAARIKILSRLNIAEKRVPQDGRMKLHLSKAHTIDFRISTLPTLFGEKIVVRILDTGGAALKAESLGMDEDQLRHFLDAIRRPYGMILVTGPTGSGKTITLYSALSILNDAERNISSVEDPVEIYVTGINQVAINEKANLTFATAMRAFLRQDPDVIMVGEMRDLETADIAVKAAQTGHLVLSTLHTNDAPSTLTRLLNMGVEPFNIGSAVHLIMAQRLVRVLCTACKKEIDVPPEALMRAGFRESELEDITLFEPVGCSACTDGFRGRTGIFQVMPISKEMENLIMRGASQPEIERQAELEQVRDLRHSGLRKVRGGITSLTEVERVTNL